MSNAEPSNMKVYKLITENAAIKLGGDRHM